jgi:hypothetical protein
MNQNLLPYISALSAMLKLSPHLLKMAQSQPSFAEVEKTIIALIANADSLDDALNAYESYRGLVPNWKFVFAADNGATPGMSVNRTFSDGSVVRSLFSKERVFVLDTETQRDMAGKRIACIPVDYSISLDNQVLSYLAPYMQGNTTRLPKDFHEITAKQTRRPPTKCATRHAPMDTHGRLAWTATRSLMSAMQHCCRWWCSQWGAV